MFYGNDFTLFTISQVLQAVDVDFMLVHYI